MFCTAMIHTFVQNSGQMATKLRKKEDTRVELRISNEDRELFEYASTLKGFKSFSEFARLAILKESQAIINEEKSILLSQPDKEIFFNALDGYRRKAQ